MKMKPASKVTGKVPHTYNNARLKQWNNVSVKYHCTYEV